MTNKALSIFNQLRPVTVGFDNVFDHFERMFDDDFTTKWLDIQLSTIQYRKETKNNYDIEVALAGFSKKDIEVIWKMVYLSIKSKKEATEEKSEDGVIHKGIAKRYFSKSFTIADDVEVKGAELKDGLLKVSLERIVPESKKPHLLNNNGSLD
jgi:molecular chaperone IbpA